MAKTSLPNSGGSQFFFVDRDSFPSHLNGVHTVFGRAAVGIKDSVVLTGLDVVDELSQVLVDSSDRPLLPVTIESAVRIGGSSLPLQSGDDGAHQGELDRHAASYTPWLSGLFSKEGAASLSRQSGTRGVFSFDASQGDRLHVLVRALELGVEPAPPLVIGERAGPLSLVAGEGAALSGERSFEVELKQDDRVLVFVPRAPAQWVKAWIEPDADQEE
jgi:hypothetical protein